MRTRILIVALIGLFISASSCLFFFIKVRERDRFLDQLIDSAQLEGAARPDVVLALSNEIYNRTLLTFAEDELDWYSRLECVSPFNVTAAVALRFGGFGLEGNKVHGTCGTDTRALLNALWRINVPARKLILLDNERGVGGGHTVIEFLNQDRWCIIDPSLDSFVWRRPGGGIATLQEIQSNRELFDQVYQRWPAYPFLFDNTRNIRWEKLGASMASVVRLILGSKRYENAKTPRMYDLPRSLFLAGSGITTVVFALLAFCAKYWSRIRLRVPREAQANKSSPATL